MNLSGDTLILIWLGALIAPPLLFGLWLRVKLMLTDQGTEFLADRELERIRAKWETPRRLRDQLGETRGKIARARFDAAATAGSYGDDVAALLANAVPFMLTYLVYVAAVAGAGWLVLF